ncbi:MAG: hypothetical protein PHN53_12905, partial [Eubacteriales bacterium]|nr:hypothetical protein [Eubacteriales bacterium]
AKNDTSRGQLAGYLYLTYADGCVSYTTTLEPGFTAKEGAHVYISYDSDAPDFRKDFDDADFACDSLCGFSGEIYFAFHSSVYLPYVD